LFAKLVHPNAAPKERRSSMAPQGARHHDYPNKPYIPYVKNQSVIRQKANILGFFVVQQFSSARVQRSSALAQRILSVLNLRIQYYFSTKG
jgi:hypothetical protein